MAARSSALLFTEIVPRTERRTEKEERACSFMPAIKALSRIYCPQIARLYQTRGIIKSNYEREKRPLGPRQSILKCFRIRIGSRSISRARGTQRFLAPFQTELTLRVFRKSLKSLRFFKITASYLLSSDLYAIIKLCLL